MSEKQFPQSAKEFREEKAGLAVNMHTFSPDSQSKENSKDGIFNKLALEYGRLHDEYMQNQLEQNKIREVLKRLHEEKSDVKKSDGGENTITDEALSKSYEKVLADYKKQEDEIAKKLKTFIVAFDKKYPGEQKYFFNLAEKLGTIKIEMPDDDTVLVQTIDPELN